METLKIPKFENEADEANWLYENRERLRERVPASSKGRPGSPGNAEAAGERLRRPLGWLRKTSPVPAHWPSAAACATKPI